VVDKSMRCVCTGEPCEVIDLQVRHNNRIAELERTLSVILAFVDYNRHPEDVLMARKILKGSA